jgi:tRNA G18 (ribose-2'-O)-methylase SpoU
LRTADGVGLEHLHFGGVTPTPDHPRIGKTALGAESSVAWSGHPDAAAAAAALRAAGHRLWALEGGPAATSLFDPSVRAAMRADGRPIVLVVGHEVSGIDRRIVELCERTLYIPMLGIKGSLNVSVAFGIAVYVLRFGGS